MAMEEAGFPPTPAPPVRVRPASAPPLPGGLPDAIFLRIASYLDAFPSVASASATSRSWRSLLYADQRGWEDRCARLWSDKAYVPEGLRVLARGRDAARRWDDDARSAAGRRSLRELRRDLLASGVPRREVAGCFERREFVDLLVRRGRELASDDPGGDATGAEPWHPGLVLDLLDRAESDPASRGDGDDGDDDDDGVRLPCGVPCCPAKLAYASSVLDARRCSISDAELCALTFRVRVRADGPFAACVPDDPWWQGRGSGTARFLPRREGAKMVWEWPEVDGQTMNPFAAMMDVSQMNEMGWEFEERSSRAYVRLLFGGHAGPHEVVARHPENWGWVLYSEATVWTSWPHWMIDRDPYVGDDQTPRADGGRGARVDACWNFRDGGRQGYAVDEWRGRPAILAEMV